MSIVHISSDLANRVFALVRAKVSSAGRLFRPEAARCRRHPAGCCVGLSRTRRFQRLLENRLPAVLIAGLFAAVTHAAEPPAGGSKPGSAAPGAPSVVTKTGNAIQRGAAKVEATVKPALRRAAAAVERAAKRTGAAVKRAADRSGDAVSTTANRTGQGVRKGAGKVQDAVKPKPAAE